MGVLSQKSEKGEDKIFKIFKSQKEKNKSFVEKLVRDLLKRTL